MLKCGQHKNIVVMRLFKQLFLDRIDEYKNSTSVAFCINKEKFTYRQLYIYVEQIYLRLYDVTDTIVCLYATDDIRTYASIFALWMLGKAYVPLNPNQPRERHFEVIRSVGTHSILSSEKGYESPIAGASVISTAECVCSNYVCKKKAQVVDTPDESLAYIIFTSGSTGKPKGVPITRGNLAHFIDSMSRIGLNITSEDRCLQPFDLTFDFSVSSYVIPLVYGASIFTIPNKAVKFTYIASLLDDYHLTVLQMVPSMIRNLLPYMDEVDLSSVRFNILCGEALIGKTIKEWHKANPNMVSYNMYGPTEDTVFCTYYLIDKTNISNIKTANDIVSIGKTFSNCRFLLLDKNDKVITEPNKEGELCLCGGQLTPGYWENDKENAAKFLQIDGTRYYHSGDICSYAEDGNLMYVNRKDFQVKINGYRVELGEIENQYSSISGGKFSVVIPYINDQGNTELAIVIEGKEYDYKDDKQTLSKKLPAYEVPNKWLFMGAIPLNQNGKVDRKAIKATFNLKQ